MDLETLNCAHGKPVREHCRDCMEIYFRYTGLPVDESAYREMRAKAMPPPTQEIANGPG